MYCVPDGEKSIGVNKTAWRVWEEGDENGDFSVLYRVVRECLFCKFTFRWRHQMKKAIQLSEVSVSS